MSASLYVVEHYQEVIVRDEESGETTMVTARKPPRLIDAYTGPGFWAYLTASRFADHLPYYRQEDILSRCGFRIGRSTQWRWMAGLATGVRPLVDLMQRLALQSRVLGVDETPVKTLGIKAGVAAKAYLWAVVGDHDHPYDCFHFTVDRSRSRQKERKDRTDPAKHLGQNSGLGLAIAAKIVARHDSWLKVESELGLGTRFRFTLTAAPAAQAPPPKE